MATYLKELNPATSWPSGPVPTRGEDLTYSPDQHKGRGGDTSFIVPRPFTIHAEKCPNRKGVEAILAHVQGEVIPFEAIAPAGRGRRVSGPLLRLRCARPLGDRGRGPGAPGRREVPDRSGYVGDPAGPDRPTRSSRGATFAEKAGCYVNADGRLQYAEASLPPRDGALPDLDIFAILMGRAGGPAHSREVLAELAGAIPPSGPWPAGPSPSSASRSGAAWPSRSRRSSAGGSTTPGWPLGTIGATGRASQARRGPAMLDRIDVNGVAAGVSEGKRKAIGR